jgi:chromosome segregation ATPase
MSKRGKDGPLDIKDILGMSLEQPRSAGAARGGTPDVAPPPGQGLRDTVTGVAQMLHDLEAQLVRVMSVNEALEKELVETRGAGQVAAKERDELAARLARLQEEESVADEVRHEVLHLQRERRLVAERLEQAEARCAEGEEKLRRQEQGQQRLAAERDDAVEESRCLETQFGRAMAAVAELRARLDDLTLQRDQLTARVRALETDLGVATEAAEAARLELEESKRAIEEIRRSILEVGAHSQRMAASP